jgi:hypothetical protein
MFLPKGFHNFLPLSYLLLPCATFGGIAQLVERLNGIQKASGSSPLISTNLYLTQI